MIDLSDVVGAPPSPIYTIGYGRRSLQEIKDLLVEDSIWLLIDVRRIPFSRGRPEFNRPNMQVELEAMYRHVPALGNAKDAGSEWRPTDPQEAERALNQLAALVEQRVVIALLCGEAEPKRCHRRQIAERLGQLTGHPVEHL